MIYVTGDTHGGVDSGKLNSRDFPEGKNLTKSDYVIIAGDFGFIWNGGNGDKHWLKWFQSKPFTTLFIDGNHENFDLLYSYPIQPWNGGKVRIINESVIYLMRGQVFSFNGIKVFTFGGAKSLDIEYRKKGESWWPEEMPSTADYEEGLRNLALHEWKVDYVITHTCPEQVLNNLKINDSSKLESNDLNQYLNEIARKITFKKWFFGHYHIDQSINENYRVLFNERVVIN